MRYLIALIWHIKLVHNRATQIFLACSNIMRQQIFLINTPTFLFHVYCYHSLKGKCPLCFFPISFCPFLCLLRSLIVLYFFLDNNCAILVFLDWFPFDFPLLSISSLLDGEAGYLLSVHPSISLTRELIQ
jgi:hypothetical protein